MVDVLGVAGKARVLADLLASLQEQQFRLSLLKEANGATDNQVIPGDKTTYGERLTELREAQERLESASDPEVLNELRRLQHGN
jgi:hypothetical protein